MSTFLIIFRVATGKGWSAKTTVTNITTSVLSVRNGPGSTIPTYNRALSTVVTSPYGDNDKDLDNRDGPVASSSATESDWLNSKKNAPNIEPSKHVLENTV